MRANSDLKKDSIFAIIRGTILTLAIVSSVFLLPVVINFINNPLTPGPGPQDLDSIGDRVAKYIDSRSSEVVFGGYTFVNVNLTNNLESIESIGHVDGVLVYGSPVTESITRGNITILQDHGGETGSIIPTELNSVANSFELALSGLEDESTDISDWKDMWPPTFSWDIAYNDGTSISLVYSKEQRVIAAVNGTWTMSGLTIAVDDTFIELPEFDYVWDDFDSRTFLILDDESEPLVFDAIQAFYGLITGAIG
ncbi:MAG: hypothetical protein ACXAEU_22080 [Candidatus Hodarchaeales archaeon]|jgi:hypothetical protein